MFILQTHTQDKVNFEWKNEREESELLLFQRT
jgi:hypothetical protein